MKSNFQYLYEFFKQSVTTQFYTLIFSISFLLAAYGVIQVASGSSYSVGIICIFTNTMYVFWLLLILLANTKNIYDIFERSDFFILRFENRKKYLKELIKTICFSNFCTVILNLILVLIGLNVFNIANIIDPDDVFTLSPILYAIYVVIKLIILTQIITILNVIILKYFNNVVVVLFNIVLCTFIANTHTIFGSGAISSITQIPLFIGDYFVLKSYSNFLFEVSVFSLYVTLHVIAISILYNFGFKKIKDIGK